MKVGHFVVQTPSNRFLLCSTQTNGIYFLWLAEDKHMFLGILQRRLVLLLQWQSTENIQISGIPSLHCQLVWTLTLAGLEKMHAVWQWLMSVWRVRNLNNVKKRQEDEVCCEPFVSVDRPAVVSHHCPWSPFALDKRIQSSFQCSGGWWRGGCLYFVRPLMESLTVRGIRDEERGFKWGGGEEGRTKKNLLT